MSDADIQDTIQVLKAEQQAAAVNGNGLHDPDDTDGCVGSKSRKEEKEAIAELKEAVLADESFSSQNGVLAGKVEAVLTALDEAVTAADDAEAKQKKAVSAMEEASLTEKDAAAQLAEVTSAMEEATTTAKQAEAALDEAVLVMGEAIIKNLDKTVTAMDPVAAAPTPQQDNQDDDVEVPKDDSTSSSAFQTPAGSPAIPASQVRRTSWFIDRQMSAERRREVEEQSRPTLNKAAMSTSIDVESVRAAYEDVRSDTSDTEWAVFKFQDQRIVCSATGVAFDAFRGHFDDNERGFGFIRFQMGDEMSKRQKFVFLTWVGPEVSVLRRAKMSIDKAMVKNIVKNFALEVQVESQAEINVEALRDQLTRVGGASY